MSRYKSCQRLNKILEAPAGSRARLACALALSVTFSSSLVTFSFYGVCKAICSVLRHLFTTNQFPRSSSIFLFFSYREFPGSPQGGENCETLPQLENASSQFRQFEGTSGHSQQLETASSYSISLPSRVPFSSLLGDHLLFMDTTRSPKLSTPSSEVWGIAS